MENNKELFAKAKAAETPEALLTLAKENGMEMTRLRILRSCIPKQESLRTKSSTMCPAAAAARATEDWSFPPAIHAGTGNASAAECVRRDIPAVFPGAEYAESCRIAITAIGALLKKGFGFAITRTNERIQT